MIGYLDCHSGENNPVIPVTRLSAAEEIPAAGEKDGDSVTSFVMESLAGADRLWILGTA